MKISKKIVHESDVTTFPGVFQEGMLDTLSPKNESDTMEAIWGVEIGFDRSAGENMARDEELAKALIDDPGHPNILRLYTWKPHAISLGFQQSMDQIDLDACRREGIDVVRRPTGGRAVYHAEELTYAVVMRTAVFSSIYATHNRISDAIIGSLNALGVRSGELELSVEQGSIRQHYHGSNPGNIACFASIARHEAVSGGRKFLGSAQRRYGEVLLQHGSIMLGKEHLRLPGFLRMDEKERRRMSDILTRETITLSEVFEREITPREAADCLDEYFVRNFTRIGTN